MVRVLPAPIYRSVGAVKIMFDTGVTAIVITALSEAPLAEEYGTVKLAVPEAVAVAVT